MAVVAGAGLTPSAAAVAADLPAAAVSSTTVQTEPGELRLDRERAQLARERAARILAEHPRAAASLREVSPHAATTSPTVVRHAGSDRYTTAAALADAWWVKYQWNPAHGPIGFEKVVVVSSGHTPYDALSGGAAAAAWGGPLLLTRKDALPGPTATVISRLKPDAIIVLGGTEAVSTAVESALADFAPVARVSGKNRYAVSAALAAPIGFSETAYIASGADYPDGLAGGAAAGQEMAPLLITRPNVVPSEVLDVLKNEVFPSTIYVLGGATAVNDSVLTQLRRELPGVTVRRVGGADRYQVAANVADLHPTTYGATVARGGDFADALAGSAFAGLVGDKVLLLRQDSVPGATVAAVRKHKLFDIDLLGGRSVVTDAVVDDLEGIQFPAP